MRRAVRTCAPRASASSGAERGLIASTRAPAGCASHERTQPPTLSPTSATAGRRVSTSPPPRVSPPPRRLPPVTGSRPTHCGAPRAATRAALALRDRDPCRWGRVGRRGQGGGRRPRSTRAGSGWPTEPPARLPEPIGDIEPGVRADRLAPPPAERLRPPAPCAPRPGSRRSAARPRSAPRATCGAAATPAARRQRDHGGPR
jgi:hypothetical protein